MPRRVSDYRLYAAIRRQPGELARLLEQPGPIADAAGRIRGARHVFTLGIGTSTTAAEVAAWQLRASDVDARAWSTHDFVSYTPAIGEIDAAIVYTHSGRKRYAQRALELLAQRGTPTVLVTGTSSELPPETIPPGAVVLRTVDPEPSSMYTFSYTAAALLSALLADAISPGSIGEVSALPAAVESALELEPQIARLAGEWHARGAVVALGAGPHEPSAHEAEIKIAEASRRPVRSYAVEQFLHGPQVQLRADESLLVFAGEGPGLERTAQAAAFAAAFGCAVGWVSPLAPAADVHASWLGIEDVGEWLAPIVEVVPAQLLAAHLAALAGVDADNFRMDEPDFRAAHNALQL